VSKIIPSLWYTEKAEEAAAFYASVLPRSRVDSVTPLAADTPSGPAGSVKVVEFTLMGQPFIAIGAGPLDPFNHSISFLVQCDDQAEIDRLWAALSEGGKTERCGWLQDRYGLVLADRARGARRDDEGSGSGARQARRRGDAENDQARHRGIEEGV
jgi:predicted 3-demethylubiquinone-9 3-methyltransferase (glyoxalase superfamily)